MGLLYTQLKVFHYPEKLDSLPASSAVVLPPLHVRVKPTNVCNHKCSYCAYRKKDMQLGQDMNVRDSIPRAKMLELIDDFQQMGVKAVTFSGGGEPFCYPHILEAAGRLADAKVKFASLTNGSRLNGEVAELFAAHATWVRISMDGWDDASYSEYRQVPDGEYSRIMANIASFQRYRGNCYVGISLIIDRKNAAYVYHMIKRLHDAGVDSVKVSPCIVSNSGRENNAYHAPIFQKVKAEVDRATGDFSGDNFEIFDSYHALDEKFTRTYSWCPNIQIRPVIGADCNVYACQDKAYNLQNGLLGSIKDQSFRSFWHSGKEKFYAIRPDNHCLHHCVANGMNMKIHEYLAASHLEFV
ncbi:MAG: radical SAM protein [Deltaproteobacteria bacterium]|nr:radical SAM protein [Deltaproteobacteria bacterium]